MSTEPTPWGSQPRSGRKILLIGPAGSGKTTLAAMYRPTARKLFIDLDEKLTAQDNIPLEVRSKIDIWSPKVPLSGARIGISRVPRFEEKGKDKIQVKGTEGYIPENPQGFQMTVDFINRLHDRVDAKDYPYDVVVFDGITKASEHLDRLVKFHHQTPAFSMPLWGIYGVNLQELVHGFLDLPGDKIMIAHSKVLQDEKTLAISEKPLIQGFMSDALPKEFNEVFALLGEQHSPAGKVFMARTRADSRYVARTTRTEFSAEESVSRILEVLNATADRSVPNSDKAA